jgi:hypothetical protein
VSAAEVAAAIGRQARTLRYTTERELQDALAVLFAAGGLEADRERPLGVADRPDFLAAGGVAVEVKVKGSPAELARQIRRYAAYPAVTGIVVVTNRARHRGMPAEIDGKPVQVVFLSAGVF